MNIPLNGRVAIVDDQIEQAAPLMAVLSKAQIPFTYFSGDVNFLPTEGNELNDIRVLFLDINLIDNREHEDKVLKGKLISVLRRIISENHLPYILIYWSRHERHKALIEGDIFKKVLTNKSPIRFLSATKLDFFNLDGSETEDTDENLKLLFERISKAIEDSPAFSYLLNWENKVHRATNNTLKDVFQPYQNQAEWDENANYLINRLGLSYAGKVFEEQNQEDKIKSAYYSLTYILQDTLEKLVNSEGIDKPKELTAGSQNLNSIYEINAKLLTSSEIEPLDYSGNVIEISRKKDVEGYEKLLDTILKKSDYKEGIMNTWKTIWLNVTPLCDAVQGKVVFHRLVRGLLVKKEYLTFTKKSKESSAFNENDAVFISPVFSFESDYYAIVLDFKQFFTLDSLNKSGKRKGLFRVRQHLLAEIQSKLARHVSRQGVLFLDDRF